MATLRCLHCLQVLRGVQRSLFASTFFSLSNELRCGIFSVGLAIQKCRHKGNFSSLESHVPRLLLVKDFSTLATENNRVLYSLINVKVKGSDEAVLKSYTEFIMKAASHLKLDISGRILLPTSIQRHTVLKSPHIYKKHRAQYEIRTHARMLQVKNVTGDTADTFLEYIQRNIPEGVSMSIEQTALESLPEFLKPPPQAQIFTELKDS